MSHDRELTEEPVQIPLPHIYADGKVEPSYSLFQIGLYRQLFELPGRQLVCDPLEILRRHSPVESLCQQNAIT